MRQFWATPVRLRVYLALVAVAALSLPVVLSNPVETPHTSQWLTAAMLFAFSILNVEVSRWLAGGVSYTQQPHKALSAWAFAAALLLPTWWLLVVVPVTYLHARWRGIRVPLWKWIGSGLYLVLCGFAAATVRDAFLEGEVNYASGDGLRGFLVVLLAAAVFLALEPLLFLGSAFLNDAEDERWLRQLLASPSFYATEGCVLLLGGLLAAVWTAGLWFALFFVPAYILVQHAVMLGPLRERAAVAVELAEKNAELDRANRFMTDLVGMLGHELGNPLTAVLGYAQMAKDGLQGDQPDTVSAGLDGVDRNTHRVASVLSDIVQLVASDRGKLTAVRVDLPLGPFIDGVIANVGDTGPVVDCPSDLAVRVQPGHLDQILTNLLSNASKYAAGATRLVAARVPDGRVELAVHDQGPGIPDGFADQLFKRYRRDDATSSRVRGTGIGLYISRELARANGGDLFHDGDHRDGSRFVVVLEAALA